MSALNFIHHQTRKLTGQSVYMAMSCFLSGASESGLTKYEGSLQRRVTFFFFLNANGVECKSFLLLTAKFSQVLKYMIYISTLAENVLRR